MDLLKVHRVRFGGVVEIGDAAPPAQPDVMIGLLALACWLIVCIWVDERRRRGR